MPIYHKFPISSTMKIEFEKNKAELEFEKSLELRNFEIDKFWIRGVFFVALLGGIAEGYHVVHKDNPEYCIYLSFLAFLVSLAQGLMNRGSKYWQERWEYHTKNKESALGIDVTKTENIFPQNTKKYKEFDLIEAKIYDKDEFFLARSKRFSVSKITILIWDIITFYCFVLWLNNIHFFELFSKDSVLIIYHIYFFHLIIIAYIFIFFLKGIVVSPLAANLKSTTY